MMLKRLITLLVAVMFSLIALNNIIDYETNFKFVKTIVSMETISTENLQWRAVTNPSIQHAIYALIIASEALVAIICWIGAVMMLGGEKLYRKGQAVATFGLSMGFALFMFAFVIVAGEWFYMWDSAARSVHTKAILLSLTMASFTYFVCEKS